MEQATLIKIARLRTLSARHGKPFDVVRFATDANFARDTLQQVLDTDQEDLLVLGLDVMNALGMVKVDAAVQPRPVAVTAPAVALPRVVPKPAPQAQQYVGRLR